MVEMIADDEHLSEFQLASELAVVRVAEKHNVALTNRRTELFPAPSGDQIVLSMKVGELEVWISASDIMIGGKLKSGRDIDERYEQYDYATSSELIERATRQIDHLLSGGAAPLKHWGRI